MAIFKPAGAAAFMRPSTQRMKPRRGTTWPTASGATTPRSAGKVAELESLGLVERSESAADRRVREAVVTAKGKAMTDLVDATRERMAGRIFATWEK